MNLLQLIKTMRQKDQIQYRNLNDLITIQHQIFTESFEILSILDEQVKLRFNSNEDAQIFYMDCNYGSRKLKGVSVSYDLNDERTIILKPVINLAQLLNHRQFGLREIAKRLKLTFKLEYIQSYSNHEVSLWIQEGKILDPQCILNFYEGLPYLSLGRLYRIMSNEADFHHLNTKIRVIESQPIV